MAQEIMNRFPHHVQFGMDFHLGVVNEDHYAINQIDICALYKCPDRLVLRLFNSEEEKEKSGVTLLHYVSELQDN